MHLHKKNNLMILKNVEFQNARGNARTNLSPVKIVSREFSKRKPQNDAYLLKASNLFYEIFGGSNFLILSYLGWNIETFKPVNSFSTLILKDKDS